MDRLRWVVLLLMGASALIVIFASIIISRRIVRPILRLSDGARRIADGRYDQEIEVTASNEIGNLASTFNRMLRSLRETMAENERQNWLKTGQAELNERMRGEVDIGKLGGKVISYLAELLGARVGAFYMLNGKSLKMIGSYAYKRRKNLSNVFALGEGLVGQVAFENKPIQISNCPDDYVSITSGLGEAVPRNIVVFPLEMNKQVRGVVELGSFEEFTDQHTSYLSLVGNSIAIALYTVVTGQETVELLERTQQQAEELQSQQEELRVSNEELVEQTEAVKRNEEELRVSNEELEEQTEALKQSGESLKLQQEELRVTNEELEENNRVLEQQKQVVEQTRQDIQEKAEELALASKYKSEFLANMSHELRTPLNSLMLLARSLSDNKPGNLDEDQVESAQVIYKSGNDLLSLINEILDLSKIEAGRMALTVRKVVLKELAQDLKAQFKHMAEEKDLSFDVSVSENTPETIATDEARLGQVIKNLVSNAIKFTERGSVMITFGVPGEKANLGRSGLSQDDCIAIGVKDTGIGIPADKRKVIFEAFQQVDGSTSRRYGGTGLGLSIARELANLIGGEIQLESEPGQGSLFTLYLPVSAPRAKREEDRSGSATPEAKTGGAAVPKGQSRSTGSVESINDDREDLTDQDRVILVIEDDATFARLLYKQCHK